MTTHDYRVLGSRTFAPGHLGPIRWWLEDDANWHLMPRPPLRLGVLVQRFSDATSVALSAPRFSVVLFLSRKRRA